MARFLFCVNWLGMPNSAQYLRLAEHLADRGHRSVVLCSNKSAGPSDYRVADAAGVSIISWPNIPPVTREDGLFFWRLLRQFRPDCVTGQFRSVNWAMLLGRLARVPLRVAWARTLHDEEDTLTSQSNARLRYDIIKKRIVYRSATHVAVLTEAQMPQLEHWFGVARSKCVVIPNSLSPPDHLANPSQPPRIVSIGRLVPKKCHRVLVEAFAQLARDKSDPRELVVVGDGTMRAELKEQTERLGVSDSVRFTGRLPHAEAMQELEKATVYAHPAVAEAFGFTIIEAMSRGVPIVASADSGIPGVVGQDGECAILVRPNDVEAFAQALDRLLKDAALRARLAEAGRRRFMERYHVDTWAQTVGRWLEGELQRLGR